MNDLWMTVVNVDHYMSKPIPHDSLDIIGDDNEFLSEPYYQTAPKVPVVRIYGTTPRGQKTVAHIHGVLPYFFIQPPKKAGSRNHNNNAWINDPDQLRKILPSIAKGIEHAMEFKRLEAASNDSERSSTFRKPRGRKILPTIAKLMIVRGMPFYGYHCQEELFIKVVLYDPASAKTVSQLLSSGLIASTAFQLFEAHIPYLLQVFADLKIEGMALLRLQNVKFRAPVPTTSSFKQSSSPSINGHDVWDTFTIPPGAINGTQIASFSGRFCPPPSSSNSSSTHHEWYARTSTCALEIDITAASIISAALDEDIKSTKRLAKVPSLAALWEDEKQRRMMREGDTVSTSNSKAASSQYLPGVEDESYLRIGISSLQYVKTLREKFKTYLSTLNTDDDTELASQESKQKLSMSQNSQKSSQAEYCYSIVSSYASQNTSDDEQKVLEVLDELHDKAAAAWQRTTSNTPQWWVAAPGMENALQDNVVAFEEELGSPRVIKKKSKSVDEEMLGILEQMEYTATSEWNTLVKDFFLSQKDDDDDDAADVAPDKKVDGCQDEINDIMSSQRDCEAILSQGDNEGENDDKSKRLVQASKKWWAAAEASFNSAMDSEEVQKILSFEVGSSRVSKADPEVISPEIITESPAKVCKDDDDDNIMGKAATFRYNKKPPSFAQLEGSWTKYGLPPVVNQEAFFLDPKNVKHHVGSHVEEFFASEATQSIKMEDLVGSNRHIRLVPVRSPPTSFEVQEWLNSQEQLLLSSTPKKPNTSQISIPTPTQQQSSGATSSSRGGFQLESSIDRLSLKEQARRNVTLICIEIHVNTRGYLLPDPLHDRINAICYSITGEEGPFSDDSVDASGVLQSDDELFLLSELVKLFQQYDPDFIIGYEVQKGSIGYILDRAAVVLKSRAVLLQQISRNPQLPIDSRNKVSGGDSSNVKNQWDDTHGSGNVWIRGRTVLNVWRIMRKELKLNRYSMEDIVSNVFKQRMATIRHADLTVWFQDRASRWRTVEYYQSRVKWNLKILTHFDTISRTSEMAQLYGMDFFSVLTRGSQYQVESVLIRVTKPLNYIMKSPTKEQVAKQAAMECIPLVMEPFSKFYPDPVVVLDFQSLYPSLMIAYNMCYSTFLGRFRASTGKIQPRMGIDPAFFTEKELSAALKDSGITVCPNGSVFCSPSSRQGVLPMMLSEILETRVMVKDELKRTKSDGSSRHNRILSRVLDARQYALKMIANVTYGYTAASFSGRMPCSELADAIVESGRKTLEEAIRMTESRADWRAKVVYGDTDSIFVHLPGRSRLEAFRIGREIAQAVTEANPPPMKLKFEKVYMGCVLLSKKRYVGLKFEQEDDTVGSFDAKGIETVRRDSCPVVAKSMEKVLRLLFKTRNLYDIQRYVERQWTKILRGQTRPLDFIFAKEVRLGTYSTKSSSIPPAALVSTKAMARDARAEPRYAERVPYVVINGPPGARLIDLVISPEELLNPAHQYTLNGHYYITKQIIPALERVFLLLGINLRDWFKQLPRPVLRAALRGATKGDTASSAGHSTASSLTKGMRTIDSYYLSKHCVLCNALGRDSFCSNCLSDTQMVHFEIATRLRAVTERLLDVEMTCRRCTGFNRCNSVPCVAITCDNVFLKFQLKRQRRELELVSLPNT